ncbi:MAG: HemK2/MTQ2 family protein methyltransferase [Candidatus Woesearchaeota archaeon]
MSTIYDPQEDSFILEREVKKYAKGMVLDLGCGSGIQGIAALECKKVTEVLFADINPDAITCVKDKLTQYAHKPAHYKISNLYSKIKIKFDTILFNPPYLPEDTQDDEKLITTGGRHGYEIIKKFLEASKEHLNDDGIILFVFSSLSKKDKIDKIIKRLKYDKLQLSKESLFMERLYVYQLKINNPKLIKGHRGIVEIKGRLAIKKSLTEHYSVENEAKFLKILNKYGIGPRYVTHNRTSLTMEYIKGDRILEYMQNSTKEQIITIIDRILEQLYMMDKLNINKTELTNPYKHIIVRNDRPVQIDFERCSYVEKPKNVTQFVQFLTSGKVPHILKDKGIGLDTERLHDLAKQYKEEYNLALIKPMIECLR